MRYGGSQIVRCRICKMRRNCMQGKFVGVKEKADVFSIEIRFIAESGKATLRATALGLYFAEINGLRAGDAYLTPGWTSYNKMLQVQEYDVTSLIKDGENVIKFTVANGWYCGRLTYLDKKQFYGTQSAVCADLLLLNGTISTGESWESKESFIRGSGIYDEEIQDDTVSLKPLTACEVKFDKSVLVEQICEPVRNVERIAVMELIRTPAGEPVYDFGQNLAGVVVFTTPGDFDGTLKLQFAEILVMLTARLWNLFIGGSRGSNA